uniref:hypothetical protein n=1 Tax=Roseovarius indicus TaxID=540747 RepID=UPI003B5263E2
MKQNEKMFIILKHKLLRCVDLIWAAQIFVDARHLREGRPDARMGGTFEGLGFDQMLSVGQCQDVIGFGLAGRRVPSQTSVRSTWT